MTGKIKQKFPLPTGYLFTGEYGRGQLETLSIGDYGKAYNIKADFLGFEDEIHGVLIRWLVPVADRAEKS